MVNALKPRWSVAFPKQLESMQQEMDQVFNSFFRNGNQGANWFAPASLWEEEGQFRVEVDLPGVRQEDVDLTLEKNVLRITAVRKPADEERKYWHQERAYGQIERLISLPETVDGDSISAELKDGVLHLTLAKRPESQPKKISIRTA